MRFRNVDWAIIGVIITGILAILALTIPMLSPFFFGAFMGWWLCGIFWTYWITYQMPKEAEA